MARGCTSVLRTDQRPISDGDPVLPEGDVREDLLPQEREDQDPAMDLEAPAVERGRIAPWPPHAPPVRKRHRTKAPPHGEGEPHGAYMVKPGKTPRGREKALEKELPWNLIPEEARGLFIEGEKTQYAEHIRYEALEPLSLEASREIEQNKSDRILGSRFAYRDKNWCKRKEQPNLPWRAKSRLVIGGHKDPDISKGLPSHAPTVSRQAIFLLLQILANNLGKGWVGYAGDITAAFLQGGRLQRELYLRQPRHGMGQLHPQQLLRILKPVFGLVDSPSTWWGTLKDTLKETRFRLPDGTLWQLRQCPLDHCVFCLQQVLNEDAPKDDEEFGSPEAYIAVHVDDLLLIGREDLCESLKTELNKAFPIDDWETGSFEYIGSFIEIKSDHVKVTQSSYCSTRLFEVEIMRGQRDWEPATEAQRHDNMSLIGALSWLAGQTRPDLQAGVSLSQQCQRDPTVGDIKFTNRLAQSALEHQGQGVVLRGVCLEKAVLLCYHDAAWANVPQSSDDPYYKLTAEEDEAGVMRTGPFADRERKAKRASSSVASQLGSFYVLADQDILKGDKKLVSILDWRSHACDRVCRSTFSAETMACANAIEGGDYINKFLETLLTGVLARKGGRLKVRFLSDCRSLFDHLTREGVPRVPSDKRLAIDLAAIRSDLKGFGRLAWVPTACQLADILTKPLKAGSWWTIFEEGLNLTFRETGESVFDQCKSVSDSTVGQDM